MNTYPAIPVPTNSTSAPKYRYYPELDVFRAFAILLVIISHWLPLPQLAVDLGQIGVTAFFVLSGFLITTILRRAHPAPQPGSTARFAGSFFARRALRLLPAYYFALLLSWILKLSFMREAWLWFALHGANIFLFQQRYWGEGTGHFWSLAVEEQFYLFWPAVVLLLPKQWLGWALGAMVGLGPLLRWWLLLQTGTSFSFLLTPACLDLFAVGGGLSLLLEKAPRLTPLWLLAGLVGGSGYFLLAYIGPSHWFLIAGPLLLALAVGCAIAVVLKTRSWLVHWIFRLPVLVAVGRISYGLYLYHLCVPVILHRLLHHMGNFIGAGRSYQAFLAWETSGWGLLSMGLLLLGLTLVSWQFIEKPFRRLQRLFPYEDKA